MTVKVEWDNDAQTIIHSIYEGRVELEDYYKAIDLTAAMMREVDWTVHHIMDRRTAHSSAVHIVPVFRYGQRKLPANLGANVIVGGTRFTQTMVNIGSVVAPGWVRDVHYFDTLEAARSYLAQRIQEDNAESEG